MNSNNNKQYIPLICTLIIYSLVTCVIVILIFTINNGKFFYALDDAYIHLALSEHLHHGHYGINEIEFASPSSSILWPYLLAFFTPFPVHEYVPLIYNITFSLLTIYIAWRLIGKIFGSKVENDHLLYCSLLLSMTVILHIYALPFSGLEHSFQVFLSFVIAYGTIVFLLEKKLKFWLICVLVIAPLVRYELLAVTCGTMLFLWHYFPKRALSLLVVAVLLPLALFSYFLLGLGLDFLPQSVLVKMNLFSSSGGLSIKEIIVNKLGLIKFRLQFVHVYIVFLSLFSLCFLLLNRSAFRDNRNLSKACLLVIVLHVLFGKWGWFARYEAYLFAYLLPMLLYLSRDILIKVLSRKNHVLYWFVPFAFTVLTFNEHIFKIIKTHLATHNVYKQQYQMHRFATEFYNKPVAVQDLGVVSYHNENYVLDLVGLGSPAVFDYRKRNEKDWLRRVVSEKEIKVVLIYEKGFSNIPSTWRKVAEFYTGKTYSAFCDTVAIYLVDEKSSDEVIAALRDWKNVLPKGTELTIL